MPDIPPALTDTGRIHEVAIIGAGPGGITAAHLLRRNGIEDFVIQPSLLVVMVAFRLLPIHNL